jgi:hypothetical protein
VQLTEHDPVQVTWQMELPLHDTLPLAPTVVVHLELPVQSRLQEARQEPAQVVWFEHEREQLPASPPQLSALNAQLLPELHEQLDSLQVGDGVEVDPQAPTSKTRTASSVRMPVIVAKTREIPHAMWLRVEYHPHDQAPTSPDRDSVRRNRGRSLSGEPHEGSSELIPEVGGSDLVGAVRRDSFLVDETFCRNRSPLPGRDGAEPCGGNGQRGVVLRLTRNRRAPRG